MIDLDRTMFFKAKFDICAEPNFDALWILVQCVRAWTLKKARRDGYTMPSEAQDWSRLKAGETLRSPDGSVRLYAALHREGDVCSWACQHVEDQRAPGCATRRWITEVGFEGKSKESGSVSIITMYSDVPGFLGPLQPEPLPNIPLLIAEISEEPLLDCTVDERPLALEPIEFGIKDIEAVYSHLACPTRNAPVILMGASRSGELPLDPHEVSALVGPNAVVYVARDGSVLEALNGLLEPHDLQCYGGALRVYAAHPHFDIPGDGFNHRFFPASALRSEEGRARCLAILRRALAQDVCARETSIRIEDIKRLNRSSVRERAFRRRVEEIQDLALEQVAEMLDAADDAAASAGEERDLALDERDASRADLRDARQTIRELEMKNASLEWSLAHRGAEIASTHRAIEDASELTVFDIGRIFVEAFPNRIDFSDRGWSSLEVCAYDPKAFWSALHSMCMVLHPLYQKGSTNISAEFKANSRFKFSRGEGSQTRANSKFMCEREDFYQGRPLNIEPHISSGTGDPHSPQFIRIYFGWDAQTGRLVIGDTRHLTNCATRKL